MSSRLHNVTAITGDYDAIERAIRETSRGRWFLATYVERNRTAETRMLLDAIARLESAMRDNGHVVENLKPMETLSALREGIGNARHDIARARRRESSPSWLPLPRFTFESIPDAVADETRAIKAAAANLEMAAQALRSAGVFHGVAQQISERVLDIVEACEAQEAATRGTRRMAQLLSELEAEIMGALDGTENEADAIETQEAVDSAACGFTIPNEVIAELSAALADTLEDEETSGEPFH